MTLAIKSHFMPTAAVISMLLLAGCASEGTAGAPSSGSESMTVPEFDSYYREAACPLMSFVGGNTVPTSSVEAWQAYWAQNESAWGASAALLAEPYKSWPAPAEAFMGELSVAAAKQAAFATEMANVSSLTEGQSLAPGISDVFYSMDAHSAESIEQIRDWMADEEIGESSGFMSCSSSQ